MKDNLRLKSLSVLFQNLVSCRMYISILHLKHDVQFLQFRIYRDAYYYLDHSLLLEIHLHLGLSVNKSRETLQLFLPEKKRVYIDLSKKKYYGFAAF